MATEVAVGHAIKTLETQWPEFSPDEAEVVMSVFLDGQRHGQVTDEELDEAINFYIDKGKYKPRRADLIEAYEDSKQAKDERTAIQWEASVHQRKEYVEQLTREEGVTEQTDRVESITRLLSQAHDANNPHRDQERMDKIEKYANDLLQRVIRRRTHSNRCFDCEGTGLAEFYADPKNNQLVWTFSKWTELPFAQRSVLRRHLSICDRKVGAFSIHAHQVIPKTYSQAHGRTYHNVPPLVPDADHTPLRGQAYRGQEKFSF